MKNITVNVPIVYVGLLLLFGLAVCDVSLLVRAFHQRTMMETAVSGQLPAEGQVLPTLRGFAEKSGNPIEINAGEAPHFALLVFREGCHYCNDNWDSWDKLFGPSGVHLPVVMITADKRISQNYKAKHPLLANSIVLVGLNLPFLQAHKMTVTPETIIIANGKVKHDWAGVLSRDRMDEIRRSVSRD